MGSESLQAHDGIPIEVASTNRGLFEMYLPGWAVNGEYNYRISASTQIGAVQLESMLHSGSHPWINNALLDLFATFDATVKIADRPKRLAQLVNFIHESQNLDNLGAGSKTGGYVAFTSRSCPYWLDFQAKNPQFATLYDYHKHHLESFDQIAKTKAGQAIEGLNVRVIDDKLLFDGTIDNDGFFSKSYDKLDEFETGRSYKFSKLAAETNNIKVMKDGSLLKNGTPIRLNEALSFVDMDLPDGTKISTHSKLSFKVHAWLKDTGLKKGGFLVSAAVLTISATTAVQAQEIESYDQTKFVKENKEFIQELVGLAVGGLGGLLAGAAAGLVSFGALSLPVGFAVSIAAEQFGQYLGGLYYDSFTDTANQVAEYIAPLLSDVGDFITDAAGAIYNFVGDIFNELNEVVFGKEGFFGLEGPLFGDGGPLQFVSALNGDVSVLLDSSQWRYDGFAAILDGTDGDDVLVHDGWGEVHGGLGDDILLGWTPVFHRKGDSLFDDSAEPSALKDERLVLDGGPGDDWVLTFAGEKAVTIGGNGRDWLFNTSYGGQLYGDTIDGQSPDGSLLTDSSNSDLFWWYPDTFIRDANKNDLVKFFGLPLVGGNNNVPFMAYGPVASVMGGGSVGLFTFLSPLYFDIIFPFMTYYR